MLNTGSLKVTTPSDREVLLTRVFNAPRQMVFDAFCKPELLKRWFGPRGWSLETCEVDFQVGGGFRFILRGPNGRTMGMRGVYREIVAPERTVHLESFDDFPGEPAQVTAVFTEHDGKTTLNATVLSPSKEVRDAVLKSGMEHGAAESYDKLEELFVIDPRQKITPCLWFDGNAEEAVNFYLSVFKTARITNITRYQGKVLTATFELHGQQFLALNGGPQYKFTEAVSFFVNCESQEEVDDLWGKLTSGGGQESRCGWLKDKYGLSWQIIPTVLGRLMGDPDRVRAQRVIDAMLKMNKIEISVLEQAYRQA